PDSPALLRPRQPGGAAAPAPGREAPPDPHGPRPARPPPDGSAGAAGRPRRAARHARAPRPRGDHLRRGDPALRAGRGAPRAARGARPPDPHLPRPAPGPLPPARVLAPLDAEPLGRRGAHDPDRARGRSRAPGTGPRPTLPQP